MSTRNKRIELTYTRFKELLAKQPISAYFDVPGNYHVHREGEYVVMCAWYDDLPQVGKIDGLPTELVIHVMSYLYQRRACSLKIEFPMDYPYKPTVWSTLREQNVDSVAAVARQNCNYLSSWSPAITIEKDVLNMIVELHQMLDPSAHVSARAGTTHG
jgi:hypothetical protein